jgi:hypothetical protein
MSEDVLKLHMLTIAVLGFLMLVTGLALYLFRDIVSGNLRYFLPIPPIGVASYIFVFNMFRTYDGSLPGGALLTLREVTYATLILAGVFFGFSLLNALLTDFLKRLF